MKTMRMNGSDKVSKVRGLLKSVGTNIGSVHFINNEGKLRKMCYRLHVKVKVKKGLYNKVKKGNSNNLIVFDVNKVLYDGSGKMCGRGAYRNVPLDRVIRVKVNGEIVRFLKIN